MDPLTEIYNACDPSQPASGMYYLDLSEVRGGGAVTREFRSHLTRARDHLRFLFSGHIGCGKSSELASLERELKSNSAAPYLPVLLDASEYLDDYDVATTDLLLAIVTELASRLRDELGIELEDNYFSKKWAEVAALLGSEVDLGDVEVPLSGARLKVQRLKKDPTAREHVRKALAPRTSTMLEEMNLVIQQARSRLPARYKDLVILVDNLEKIQRFEKHQEGLESQKELFLERYAVLTGIEAHVLYTVPLRLVRSPLGPQLEQRYGPLRVLPMVKVRRRGSEAPYKAGVDCLRRVVERRIHPLAVADAFEPAALDFLLRYCGGHVRQLMTFLQNACVYSSSMPISLDAARRAVQQSVRTYSTAIPDSHWAKLARVEMSDDQQIVNGDADYLVMLENLSLLEYVNGNGDEENPFEAFEPWYAVNPIVRELGKFKKAVAEQS